MHAHYFSRAYIDLLEALHCDERILGDARRVISSAAEGALGERLAAMDGSRVERQMLSMSAVTPYLDDRKDAVRAACFLNDEHAAVCRNHPERFGFFATLPMPHVDAALDEIRRAYDDLQAAGVTFTTSIRARSLADPAFAPVFAELDRRAAVVFLHPPGFLPFLRYRLDKGAAERRPGADPPSVQLRKFWYDTANGEPDALRHAAKAYGADRIVFGSDYPYWTGAAYEHAVHYLETAGLAERELTAIRSENARKVLSLWKRSTGSKRC